MREFVSHRHFIRRVFARTYVRIKVRTYTRVKGCVPVKRSVMQIARVKRGKGCEKTMRGGKGGKGYNRVKIGVQGAWKGERERRGGGVCVRACVEGELG